jgi:hypothetical protein
LKEGKAITLPGSSPPKVVHPHEVQQQQYQQGLRLCLLTFAFFHSRFSSALMPRVERSFTLGTPATARAPSLLNSVHDHMHDSF